MSGTAVRRWARRMIAVPAALSLLLAAPPAPEANPHEESDAMLREHLWQQVRRLPAEKRPRVGLVLSAGAVRGLAHIGVIHVLEDAGFPVDVVAGTSMGAVIGALYAGGFELERLWEFGATLRMGSGSNLSGIRLLQLMLADKLLSSKNAERELVEAIGDVRFDQLDKPFACVAMDIRTGEKVVFRDGLVAPAVRASMTMPGVFQPVHYRHRYLVDGGVVDHIPADAAKLLGAEWVIASVTLGDFSRTLPRNVLETLEQIFDIRGALLARDQRREADAIIDPDVGQFHFFEIERSEEIMEKGVEAAKAGMDGAKDGLILFTLPRLLEGWVAER
ncbi:patatin-like phospholipase family protein [Elusimicrobiota bacterium]